MAPLKQRICVLSLTLAACSSSTSGADTCAFFFAQDGEAGYWRDVSESPQITKREQTVDLLRALETLADIAFAEVSAACDVGAAHIAENFASEGILPEDFLDEIDDSSIEGECAGYRDALDAFLEWRASDNIAFVVEETSDCALGATAGSKDLEQCLAAEANAEASEVQDVCETIAQARARFFGGCTSYRYTAEGDFPDGGLGSSPVEIHVRQIARRLGELSTLREELQLEVEVLGQLAGTMGAYFSDGDDASCIAPAENEVAVTIERMNGLIAEVSKIEALLLTP